MRNKTIYSLEVLQRIIDHWGIGTITLAQYFESVGGFIWRHSITTTHGEFELYSFDPRDDKRAQEKLTQFFDTHRGRISSLTIHSFDRYHILIQQTKKYRISASQMDLDLQEIIGTTLDKAFRVYGTILQLHFSNNTVPYSYATWNLQHHISSQETQVLIESNASNRNRIDEVIEALEAAHPRVTKFDVKGKWFSIYFSNQQSLHFKSSWNFPALEVNVRNHNRNINVFSETEIWYIKEIFT